MITGVSTQISKDEIDVSMTFLPALQSPGNQGEGNPGHQDDYRRVAGPTLSVLPSKPGILTLICPTVRP